MESKVSLIFQTTKLKTSINFLVLHPCKSMAKRTMVGCSLEFYIRITES